MKFITYRGSSSGSIWGLKPFKVSSKGTFGNDAVYFALDKETAKKYASSAHWFWAIITYEVEVNNPLIVSEENFSNLKNYDYGDPILVHGEAYKSIFPEKIQRSELLDLALSKGYDSIYLKGNIENGEELVVKEASILPTFIEVFTNLSHNFEKKNSEGFITYWDKNDFKKYIDELIAEGKVLGIDITKDEDSDTAIYIRGSFSVVKSLGEKHFI